MTIQALNPYVILDGGAQRAIEKYQSALGATHDGIMRWGDVPAMETPKEHAQRVMHCKLQIGAGTLMIADTRPGDHEPSTSNVKVCLDFSDVADMTRRFDALGKGGSITMPLQDMFWGARFGMLTDEFGVQWMFNCAIEKCEKSPS